MLISALASAPVTIERKRTASVRGTSSTQKLGARCGTVDRISEVMLVWIAASVTIRTGERRVGKECGRRVDIVGLRIFKKTNNKKEKINYVCNDYTLVCA